MSARTKPPSLHRRRSQVYVDIPPFRLHSPVHTAAITAAKENAPLHPLRTNTQENMATLSASKKRKTHDDDDTDDTHEYSETLSSKKQKQSSDAAPPAGKAKPGTNPQPKADTEAKAAAGEQPTEEYPNGFFYCHQCTRKRDNSCGVHCTYKHEKNKGGIERCRLKYCKACLKNRYQEDLDSIKSHSAADLTPKQRAHHVSLENFFYQCPRCRDECNCRVCRKAKGLEPTGNLNLAARKAAKAEAIAQKKIDAHAAPPAKPKAKKSDTTSQTAQANGMQTKKTKLRAKPKVKAPPPKPMPRPLWTRVPTDLTQRDAETRIHIREFVVRFSSLLQIAQSHLEELDEISGDNLGEIVSWSSGEIEGAELISWISDLGAKSIVQGLLEVLAGSMEATGAEAESKALKEAAKSVKNSGANLSRLWTAMLSLRESLGLEPLLVFSDPLPPPAATIIRTTRQTRDSDSVHIANSAQLIPVIADLIEAAVISPAIRDALEQGPIEEKDCAKLAREAIATENNRWKDAKDGKDITKDSKQKGGPKALRDQHNQLIEDLEFAGRLAALRCIPRWCPLGRDADGRMYYAMTPGVGESEASISLLKGKDGVVRVGRKRGGFSEDDRQELERWSWFVAVWGRKPDGADEAKRELLDDEDELSDIEADEECWWGFWQPQEISKMAEWITLKYRLDEASTKPLVGTGLPTKVKGNGVAKLNGSRSRTTTGSSALSSVPPSHPASALSDMSDLSDDEDTGEWVNFDVPTPNTRELRDLAQGLKDFSSLLSWRIKRASAQHSKEKSIPTSRFYA